MAQNMKHAINNQYLSIIAVYEIKKMKTQRYNTFFDLKKYFR